jgi:CRP-like cAMP-binding protein
MLTVIEKVLFLQNIDVFQEVPTEHLGYMASIAEEIRYSKDDVIYKINEHSDAMYLVLEGKVRLHIDQKDITVADTKEAFGTWALFDDSPRVVTATALEDSWLLKIDREEFVDLLADHVQMTQAILKTMVLRMRSLVDRVGLKPIEE